MTYNYKILFIVAWAFIFSFCTQGHGEENIHESINISEEVSTILNENAKELDPISFVWRRTRTSKLDIKTLLVKIKCLYDYDFLGSVNNIFMSQNGKIYHCFTDRNSLVGDFVDLPYAYEVKEKKLELEDSFSERTFDGNFYYVGNGHETKSNSITPGLMIFPINRLKERTFPDVFLQEYTAMIGYKFPNSGLEIGNNQQSYIQYLINQGKILHVSNEGDTFFIKIQSKNLWDNRERIYDFHLILSKNYAIKKININSLNGKIIYEVENNDFFQLPNKSIFLPNKTTVKNYSYIRLV